MNAKKIIFICGSVGEYYFDMLINIHLSYNGYHIERIPAKFESLSAKWVEFCYL